MRAKVQQFGSFVTQMIIPNMGAFIAWGLITTLFISVGWTPNEQLAKMVGPMLTYLLPILIGFAGGRLMHGFRGGVVGAAATMGVIVGADIPMLLAAMFMGPLAGWLMKKFDTAVEDRIPSGFEMLVNNFSAGILAAMLAVFGNLLIGPIVQAISTALGAGVQALVDARLLPLVDILIEPGKVLFMNNAINHGVLGPLGAAQVQETGRSLLYMLESNPGPGLGLLLAFWVAGKGMLKASAPSAVVIHFLGGIHEIYFPYVLAKPIMILAMWAGGILADLWFVITNAGLVAPPAPGSIMMFFAMTPNGQFLPVMGGVLIGAVASFLVASFLLKVSPMKAEDEEAAATGVSIPATA